MPSSSKDMGTTPSSTRSDQTTGVQREPVLGEGNLGLPWKAGRVTLGMCSDAEVLDAEDNLVAIIAGGNWRAEGIPDAELTAKLDLIVRAVNSHDELVEALQILLFETESLATKKSTRYANLFHAVRSASAALSKALGTEEL